MAQPARDPAFRAYLAVQRQYDRQMVAALEAAAKDIERRIRVLKVTPGIGAQVRASQLRVTLAAIHADLADLWRGDVTRTVMTGGKAAAKAAEIAIQTLSDVAYASLPERDAEALVRSLRASSRAGIDAAFARVPRALSEAVYRNEAVQRGIIDGLVRSGLSQGLSAKELARTVYQHVSPTTPGGASYAAMRLARTEINNAFHEQQIKTAHAPGVKGVKWNLSGSHPKPDVCNQYAEEDHSDLGAGVYRVGDVPGKPHPHCFCYLTYVTLSAREFAQEVERGSFDDELRRRLAALRSA